MAFQQNVLWMDDKQKSTSPLAVLVLCTAFFSYPPSQETVQGEADVGLEVSLPSAGCLCGSERRWGPRYDSLRWAGGALHHRWGLSGLAETSNTCMWAFLAIRWCEGAPSLNPAHTVAHLFSSLDTPTVTEFHTMFLLPFYLILLLIYSVFKLCLGSGHLL